jgi:colanic acid/amylovoran biosynthesis protein
MKQEPFMKLLILGNHTCGNRGDSAILRGLLDAINTLNPDIEVDVMSRYPVSSSWLLNRPVMGDPLYSQMKQHNNAAGVMGRVKKVLRRRYQHQVLLSRVTDTGKLRNIAIAQGLPTLSVCCRAMTPSFRWGDRFCRSLWRAAV